MARRKKGRDIHGWLVIDKPAGLSSTAVVNKVKWAFDAKKAGHSGTLDPAATGVLAVALGEATKTVPFVTDADKAYRFEIRLGQATDTDDAEGDIIDSRDSRPSDAEIKAALPAFTGDITQVPPQFSAVKVEGERAYRLAREGEALDLVARPLHVAELDLVERPDPDHAVLSMVCGKGGYVRSIARDLGEALGCLAHVIMLRRVWTGPFALSEAVTLEQIEALARTEAIDDLLMPVAAGLTSLPRLVATEGGAAKLRNGNPGEVITGADYGATCWAEQGGQPVAVGTYRGGLLHPNRVFNL